MYDNEIKPDYIVGDFDSVPRKLVEYYREELDVPVREFNPVKDASDTEIALRLCLGLNRKRSSSWGQPATGSITCGQMCNVYKLRWKQERTLALWTLTIRYGFSIKLLH